MAMNSPMSRDTVDFEPRSSFSSHGVADRSVFGTAQGTATHGSFTELGRSLGSEVNGKALPPRRAGAPPRLLGDHPTQIAQTSVPITASRPKNDPIARKKEVRAARRWDNAKMVALSFIVFGLIGGTIQWTRTAGSQTGSKVIETQERTVQDSQVKLDEQEPQVASNIDTTPAGAWREQ